jgi:putative lipase involved disintegration of autophagic bodies
MEMRMDREMEILIYKYIDAKFDDFKIKANKDIMKAVDGINEGIETLKNVEKLKKDVKSLKGICEELIDKHSFLTEVSFIARQRGTVNDMIKVNHELIQSMDFDGDWFSKRNSMPLNKLYDMYKNGVQPDNE